MAGSFDYILIGLYIVFLLVVSFRRFSGGDKSVDEYLVMGRRLALPGFVASLVSTWYGGILGVGEYSYTYGLSNWVVFGLPYYLGAFLFAIFLAKKARSSQLYTIPDQLDKTYGRKASLAGAFLVFVTTIPAAYVLQIGFLAKYVAGIPLSWGVIGGAILSILYVLTGGLRNDVITDRAQFVLMFTGFIMMLIFLYISYGGLSFISSNVPHEHLTLTGGRRLPYVLVWYFIALGTMVDPSFYQRCFAAKSESVAKKGIFIAIAFWAFFDFMTTSTGLYAKAILPDLADPATSYPALAFKVLPDFLRGLFLLGLFATIMSTIDSFTLLAGQTIGKDFIHRIWGKDPRRMTQLGIVLAGLIAIWIALFKKSVIGIWYDLGSIATASLLIPLITSFNDKWKMRPKAALVSIIAGGLVVVIWMISGYATGVLPYLGIDPIYPGLLVSILIYIYDKL